MSRAFALAALATLALAGCTAPPPRQAPAASPPPPPPPPPVPVLPPPGPGDWRDLPLTAGGWTYARDGAGSSASYGPGGAPLFVLRCDPARQVVTLTRPGAAGTTMIVQTSYASRTIPAASAGAAGLVASLAARDPTLDQMAFSRGRFSIAGPGLATLYLPAWAEPARVVEDCR